MKSLLMSRFRGAARLRSLLRGAHPFTLGWGITRDGVIFGLDPESYIDGFVLRHGYYEREVLSAILNHLPIDGVFWDVGANIGLHGLTVKKLVPEATVVCFEPVPSTSSRLIENARANGMSILILLSALGVSPGYARLAILAKGNAGLSSLNPWPNVKYDSFAQCRVERADDLIAFSDVPSPTVMKIDVEGFELEVLKGAAALLRRESLKAIIFESDGEQLAEIRLLLSAAGFSISPLAPENKDESSHPSPNYLAHRN